jgi:hypothetical protein
MGCRDVPGASQPRDHPLDSPWEPERAESLGNGDLSPETRLSA